MKKILLILSALMVTGLCHLSAQLIDANFETWHSDYVAINTNDPNSGNGSSGWWDFNFDNESFIFGASPVTVFEGSSNPSPEDSSHYAVIVSATMTQKTYGLISGYGFSYPQTNGALFTAYLDINPQDSIPVTFKLGIPFTKKIDTLTFWYRYIPNGSDTCSCTVTLSHYSHGASHLIGGGLWTDTAKKTMWTKASVPITYDSIYSTPDTAYILLSACSLFTNGKPKPGDTLDVDNINYHISRTAGIDNINAYHDNVTIYPNPAQTNINIAISGFYLATHITVYDITGRVVGAYLINHNFLTIDTQSYPNGLYIYKLLDNYGNPLNVGKFSVEK